MKFITALLDALIGFVQRNPLTTLVIVFLALAAPTVLKGIAVFILYMLMGVIILVVALLLLFRWRLYKIQRQMQDQFGGQPGNPFADEPHAADKEGDVKIYKTSETPEKRVSKNVGDYVEFEETKEPETK